MSDMQDIKREVETVMQGLRDLMYRAHEAWENGGMKIDDGLLTLSNAAGAALTSVSTAVIEGALSFSAPSKVRAAIPNAGLKKIQAIKAMREYTGLGLKEAKDIIDVAGTSFSEIKFAAGYDSSDEATVKKFKDDLAACGYEVK